MKWLIKRLRTDQLEGWPKMSLCHENKQTAQMLKSGSNFFKLSLCNGLALNFYF